MGLFDLFGKSFDQQVQDAINEVGATTPGVSGLRADVRGKVITLKGNAESREAANLAMQKVDQAVKADNIVNSIEVAKAPEPEPAPAPEPVVEERVYEVVAGDTSRRHLSEILWQGQRLHEDFRGEPRHPRQPGSHQGRPKAEDSRIELQTRTSRDSFPISRREPVERDD